MIWIRGLLEKGGGFDSFDKRRYLKRKKDVINLELRTIIPFSSIMDESGMKLRGNHKEYCLSTSRSEGNKNRRETRHRLME